MKKKQGRYLKHLGGLARAAAVFCVACGAALAASPATAEFFAEQDLYGELKIVDSAGAEVNVAVADPVGTRPDPCPGGAYYVAEVPTDSSKLVLSDCATGTEQHTVELQGQ